MRGEDNPLGPFADMLYDVARVVVPSLIILSFSLAVIVFAYLGIISADFFMGVASTVIAFLFGQRNGPAMPVTIARRSAPPAAPDSG